MLIFRLIFVCVPLLCMSLCLNVQKGLNFFHTACFSPSNITTTTATKGVNSDVCSAYVGIHTDATT